MKRRQLITLSIIAIFIIFSVISFQNSLTPYVSFAQAKTMKGSVQVRGVLGPNAITQNDNGNGIQFMLRDENGEAAMVVYQGSRPEGMEQAASLVAIGKYGDGRFSAEKLLVKCPSKYQGIKE
ncbi:MAG TPA: cytochrome c maturation protein CcmE [Negativicutes bacterium]